MAEIVLASAAEVAESLVALVYHSLVPAVYLKNCRSNSGNLKKEVEKLEDRRAMVQPAVDYARSQGEEVELDVENWLDDVEKTIEEVVVPLKFAYELADAEQRCCKVLCPNLKKRYELSRKAKKALVVILQARCDGNFYRISYRPALRRPPPPLTTRRSTLNAILEAGRDADVELVGVYGLGGSGKTTLVKKVYLEEHAGYMDD